MEPGRGSLTAERVAERRAAHQLVDRPRVFDDPLALAVIRPDAARRLQEDGSRADRSPLSSYLRAFVSMRSRFAEDELARAYGRGVRQYVVLGAGFDTFAYRSPHPGLHVFEVDHPDTQAVKRQRLLDASIAAPAELTFVPADLTRESLADCLPAAGFNPAAPTFVAWLGVSMYLSLADVRTTLATIGSFAAGSCLVLDYAVPPASLSWVTRTFYRVLLGRVEKIGEPWKTFFDPASLATELAAAGLEVQEDLGADEINRRFFANRSDGLQVSVAGRIASACVRPPFAG